MKTLLLLTLVVLLSVTTTKATNYYFSSLSGDDSRTSTQAKSASTPWKTLGKLNSFFSSLQPGDSVLFKRGETFYGSIAVNKAGTTTLPIVLSAYGTGEKPIITSLVSLGSWVSKGNGIWESYNSSLGSVLNMVLINGDEQEMGRYPNSDAANNGYLTFETHSGKTSVTDNELNSSTSWAGAELVIRTRRWILDRSPITSNSANTIYYTNTSVYEPYDKYGYFIQNSIKTLDKFGEWYYSPSTKKLSVYFGSNSPTAYTVQASTVSDLIHSANFSNIVFDNLSVKGSNGTGFTITNGSNINIKNCDVSFSGEDAVIVNSSPSFKFENCTVANSNNNGMFIGSGTNAIIRNNKILNTGLIKGLQSGGEGNATALRTNGDGNIIEYNEIRNTGYIGIYFNGSNVSIKNNLLDSFCLIRDDGAGIYSHSGSVVYSNRKVTGNVVMNAIGDPNGTDNPTKFSASGMYLDNGASPVEITGNTFANCNRAGLYIHNSGSMTVRNNTIFNNDHQLDFIQDNSSPSVRNNVINSNILFSKTPTQLVTIIKSDADDISSFGKFDSNYYARPIDDRVTIYNYYPGSTTNFDLDGWKKTYSKDAASKRTARQIAAYRLSSLVGSTKVADGGITSISGIGTSSCATALGSSGQLDGTYLQVTPSAKKSSVSMKIGGITAGKKYILKYSVRGSVDDNTVISSFLRLSASPYTILTPLQNRKVSTTRSENDMIFLATSTQAAASIVFQVDQQSKYYLDNIQVYEANATMTDVDDSLKFVYNASKSNKTISLDGTYMDSKGSSFAGSITLQPYTSSVLLKNTNGIASNAAPSVSITSPANNATFGEPASITINATATDADGSITKVDFYSADSLIGSDNTSPYSFTWNNVAAGDYSITAKATDNDDAVKTSAVVSVSVSIPNATPTVSVTSPVANAKFDAPASITISATAADADGSVTKVDFYNGSNLIGSDNTSPYSFTWNNVAAGSYSLTAKATDNDGAVTASSVVSVSVSTPNAAPTVSITSPVTNSKFDASASITINATATDADGSVTKVDFYNGSTLIGSDNTSPYSFTWSNVAAGSYSLTAKATDNDGAEKTSAVVSVSVSTPNVAPTISITSPVANAKFDAPASIAIAATAVDADGSVTKVDFYNGSTLIGSDNTSPYSFTWNNVAAGSYSLTAKATDNDGAVAASSVVSVSVSTPNAAPTVSITSPVTNSKFDASASITINATATDADGSVTKVDFYNGSTLIGSDNTSPYSFTWNNVAAGNYTLTAKATDNDGAVAASSAVGVSVSNPNVAPTVSITSPVTNAKFDAPASITINATATDADGSVTKVDFYNGSTLIGSDNTSPYSFTWNNVAAGSYSLTAKATDNDGAVAASSAVGVSVSNPNGAPTVSITSPVTNSKFDAPASITINATATDADGSVTKVDFYNGSTLIGSDNTSPYSFTWNNVAAGSYSLTAKATDNDGAAASSAVGVSVSNPNGAPTVSITSPVTNSKFDASASITINATATDADGSVTKVDFYNGSTLIGSDNTSPYSFTWNNVAVGNYSLTAKATDNGSLATISSTVGVSVLIHESTPVVSITSPVTNAKFEAPASITINATAADADGTISKVDFYNGTTLIGSDNTSPYSFTWNNVAAGNYSLTAKATDNGSLATTSSAVAVSVSNINLPATVSITSPVSNDKFDAPASITINATADDSDGSVTKVDFYNGTTLIGSDNTSPYSFTWNNVAAGNYTLTAKAIDNGSLVTTSSAVTVSVSNPNVAPKVKITSPSIDTSYAALTTIKIAAEASDSDGSITKVEFLSGGKHLFTSYTAPYRCSWQNAGVGTYAITVVATDNNGVTTISSTVLISVSASNVAPAVSITNPQTNTSFDAASSITISATADDADGSITKVDFYNGDTFLGSDNTSPYSFTWNNVAGGNYTLTAKATDNGSIVTTSAPVVVSVANPNAAPKIKITNPSVDTSYASLTTIKIAAEANDLDGSITKVEFLSGGKHLYTTYKAPYHCEWQNVRAGTYTITAIATDNNGVTTTSTGVLISVSNLNVAPTVSITSPQTNASFDAASSITINATAADADGSITKVDFYNGDTFLGSDNTSPYSFTWNNVTAGNYTLTAKATDNGSLVTTASAVTVSVSNPNVAPTVSITSPQINASFDAASSITVNATATDADGSVVKVDFYNGDTFLGSDNTSPYSFTLNNAAAGNYSLTAKATDNGSLVTTSSTVVVLVSNPNGAPTVSITSPQTNASFDAASSITISATAADADGSVTKVDFYNGTTLIGSDNTSPYSITLNNTAAGNYSLTAKATDNGSLVTTSSTVVISVSNPNVAPTVTITSPQINASFDAASSITINATAVDADGSVTKVDFYNGTTLIGSDNTSPYSFTWNNVAAGGYSLTAKATDNGSLVTISSAVSISVAEVTVIAAPTVSITSPETNASFDTTASITIDAIAADADGSVTKVDFYNDGTLLGTDNTSPYSFTWKGVGAGKHSLTAKAYDNTGLATVSKAVPVEISLPLDFAFQDFSATVTGKQINLLWVTNNTGNSSYFRILNGKRRMALKEIGRISYVDTASETLSYTFADLSPITGANYYKIIQVDNKGNQVSSAIILVDNSVASSGPKMMSKVVSEDQVSTLSKVTDVVKNADNNSLENISVKVGPNPTTSSLSIYMNGLQRNKELKISVLSLTGRVVKTIESNTLSPVVHINVSSLDAGIYLIQLASGDTVVYKQFVKQ